MDIVILVLFIIILIACIIFTLYMLSYNKFQDVIIRINEVEAALDNNLRNKYDLLSRSVSIIKTKDEEVKIDAFEEIVKLRSRKIGNFDLDRKLINAKNELLVYKDKDKEIATNDEIKKILKQLSEIDEHLDTQRDYYNKNISLYNKMIKKFPENIVARFNKYEEKLYFDRRDMNDEDFEDFKL